MDEGGKTTRSDLWGGVGWIAFGLLILAEALRMDRFVNMGASLYTMPGFVPGMIGVVIVVLGMILMARGWRSRKSALVSTAGRASLLNRRTGITIVLTLTYAAGLIGRAPFWLATAVFVSSFTWLFAPEEQSLPRRLVNSVIAGVLTSAIVSIVFQEIFLVRLP